MFAVPGYPTTLSANWSAPIPKNGIIVAYSVYCNTSINQTYPEQGIGPNAPTRSVVNETILTIVGLKQFTQYSCYVTANTSVEEGNSSATLSARTVEGGIIYYFDTLFENEVLACSKHSHASLYPIVPSSPLNFSLFSVPGYPTTLSANWSAPIPKNGIIVAYSVYCNTSINQTYPEQVIGPNAPTRSVVNVTRLTIVGLNPFTQYSCYVTANTSVGEGSPSNIVTVQTAQSGNIMLFDFEQLCCSVVIIT